MEQLQDSLRLKIVLGKLWQNKAIYACGYSYFFISFNIYFFWFTFKYQV